MLDLKYAVKYPFPHSVVHIIDNSIYTGELPVVVADNPSLYSTIVVSGAPMGVSNRMVPVYRSDVANVAFGLGNLSASTIKKYGQAITYVNSLISQNVPVQFMRVTPDDAGYGAAIVVVQWRIDSEDGKLHVRFKNVDWPASLDRTSFKNTARVNEALTKIMNTTVQEDAYTWSQRAFINVIPAGKGSAYNNMGCCVNMTTQGKRPSNVNYLFATINAQSSQIIEQFEGSLVNDNGDINSIDTANNVVARRIEGSSVLVPYVNEEAVRELYSVYSRLLNDMIEIGIADDYTRRVAASTNVNTFDVIYGNYIYNGTDSAVKLPYYQVDTVDTDIVRLGNDYLIDSLVVVNQDDNTQHSYAEENFQNRVIDMSKGLLNANDEIHVGDLYLTPTSNSKQYPKISIIASINQYTGAVTSVTIPKVFKLKKEANQYIIDIDSESVNISLTLDELVPFTSTTTELTYNTIVAQYPDLLPYAQAGTVGEGSVIAGTNGSTFELYYVLKSSIRGTSASGSITLVKYNIFNLYYGLDRNSHKNKLSGTGNVIAWNYGDTRGAGQTWAGYIPTGYNDAVLNQVGFVVVNGTPEDVTTTTAASVSIQVNNYDGNRLDIPFAKRVYGQVPTQVSLDNDAVGTMYDVLTYSPTSIDTFRVNDLGPVTLSTETGAVQYKVGDLVSVVIDTDYDTPKQFNNNPVVISGDTSTGSKIYSVLEEDRDDVVYELLTTEPVDWATAYTAYFTKSGDVYTPVTGDTAPTFEADTYYEQKPKYEWVDSLGNTVFYTSYDATAETKYTGKIDPADLSGDWAFWDANSTENDVYIVINDTLELISTLQYTTDSGDLVKVPASAHTIIKVTSVDTLGNITGYVFVKKNAITNNNGATGASGVDLSGVIDTEYPLVTINGYNGGDTGLYATAAVKEIDAVKTNSSPNSITRYLISGSLGTMYRIAVDPTIIPSNYYNVGEYGVSLNSEDGGVKITGGSTGFFDDENINSIEYKWKYSALLTRAFKGELDKRIMSPTRCPARFLPDGAYNTIVGANIVPELTYTTEEIINASTIFTEDEKEQILFDKSLIAGIANDYSDIDVKAAMYELMDYRVFQGMPEGKRPQGQGSGLSVHFDSGVVDDKTMNLVEASFNKRFNSYNASWDIGGYVDAATGLEYTFTKRIVDNMYTHMQNTTVNKPFVGAVTAIPKSEYISYFPDIDTVDWEKRGKSYTSGGNVWVVDVNGNLTRRSQRTLYRQGDTSDLMQESNARTLSQLVYLLQNKIDTYLFEYADDDMLKTMTDDCNIMFSNWVGSRVDDLDISFERDINPIDGGEVVVCYVRVVFRGLVLRVPIIVDVQRRNG